MSTALQRPEPSPETVAWIRRSGWPQGPIEPLSGDVSPRRYYRLRREDGQSAVLVTYRGVIAHEVAHAVVQQHAPGLNRTAQEYLAHATQLSVQPESRRQQIITVANVGPWQLDDVISDIYMAMALTQFAVKCYLHLTEHPKPIQLVQMLLASKWRFVVVVI